MQLGLPCNGVLLSPRHRSRSSRKSFSRAADGNPDARRVLAVAVGFIS